MPPSPNQNAFFAALQQRSRLPDVATTWRWVGRDEAGLAIIRSDNGTIARARIAGNAAIGDGDVVLYVPPQRGQSLGQVQLPTALAPEFIRRRQLEEDIDPPLADLPIKGLFSRFASNGALEFFIGNDRPTPEKIFELPPGTATPGRTLRGITATGAGLNDWIVTIAILQPGSDIETLYIITPSSVSVVPPSGVGFVECYGAYAVAYRDLGSELLEATSYLPGGTVGTVVVAQSTLSTQRSINWRTPTFAQVYLTSVTGFEPLFVPTLSVGSVFNPADGSSLGQGRLTESIVEFGGIRPIAFYDDGSILNGTTAVNFFFSNTNHPFGSAGVFGDSLYEFNGLPLTPSVLAGTPVGEVQTINIQRTSFANPSIPAFSSESIEYYGVQGFDDGNSLFILNASYFPQ